MLCDQVFRARLDLHICIIWLDIVCIWEVIAPLFCHRNSILALEDNTEIKLDYTHMGIIRSFVHVQFYVQWR